jgi:predicted DNA-binding helix-hairpin-helix protein
METIDKLRLLSDASRYDLACACGTNDRDRRKRGADGAWLYPVSMPSGGYSVLLKTLISNVCANDCKYCPFRLAVDAPRCTIEPEAMARIFMEYVGAKKVFGLFLSSGVTGTPDRSMALLNDTAAILRGRYRYRGYVHLKIIPGASDAAIESSLSLADAVSLNIETPGVRHCRQLSTKKDFERDIIGPLKRISVLTGKGMKFERVKTTTQFIVGASDETDREIMTYTSGLYDRLKLHRVYFSAYQRGGGDASIPGEFSATTRTEENFVREHRIYQADFLLRRYRFTQQEFVYSAGGMLPLDKDPKQTWADHHPERFPVAVASADRETLLRVPGIGPVIARRILARQKEGGPMSWEGLGIGGKRRELIGKYAVVR